MAFISERQVIHGDLAARNILLTDQKEAKVTDFGLSKSLYQHLSVEIHQKRQPIKWLGYEVLDAGKNSIKGDVWSFAILMWEIFMFGATPYGGNPLKTLSAGILCKEQLEIK